MNFKPKIEKLILQEMASEELIDWKEWAEDEMVEYQEFINDIELELDKR